MESLRFMFLWFNICPKGFCVLPQFAAQEEKRQKNERLHQHQKHENQMRDLQLQCDCNIRELQQLQVGARTPPSHHDVTLKLSLMIPQSKRVKAFFLVAE